MSFNLQPRYFWSESQIFLASGFAGPLVGCYFLGKNFQELGLPRHAKKSFVAGVVATILVVAFLIIFPEDYLEKIPNFFLPLASSLIISAFAQHYQKQLIKEKVEEGSKLFSWWRFLLLTLSFIIIQIFMIFFFIFVTSLFLN